MSIVASNTLQFHSKGRINKTHAHNFHKIGCDKNGLLDSYYKIVCYRFFLASVKYEFDKYVRYGIRQAGRPRWLMD